MFASSLSVLFPPPPTQRRKSIALDNNNNDNNAANSFESCNFTGHAETKKVTSFIGDICEPTEEVIGRAFQGVDCVFHCAAFINFQFPPNLSELERVNVNGKISHRTEQRHCRFLLLLNSSAQPPAPQHSRGTTLIQVSTSSSRTMKAVSFLFHSLALFKSLLSSCA